MSKETLQIKYRFKPFITILSIVFSLCIGIGIYSIRNLNEPFLLILLFSLMLLFLFAGVMQVVLVNKEYHVFIDRKKMEMVLDMGIRKKKVIDLSVIKGFSSRVQRNNSTTFYVLQFLTTPTQWGEFYHKNDSKLAFYNSEYEAMYIVVSLTNQKEEDLKKINKFLIDAGIEVVDFQPSVLGSYPGILKKAVQVDESHTPLEKKQKRRQLLSYFLARLLFMVIVFHFVVSFIGIFHGIYW